jgi:hypothetical protein
MAINITSLFQDILESPEQKQQRQMAEGFARNQNAVSQLTGLATAAAPLVGTMAELQGRRTEDLQRGVGRLLGRDVRSTSEKLQQALGQFNPQDPRSVSQTTQMLQSMGLGAQGAQLAAMALEEQQKSKAMTEEEALRKQQATSNELGIQRSQQQIAAETLRAEREQQSYDQAGAIINQSSQIVRRVNPALADTFEGLFPATPEGAVMAREAAIAAVQAPKRELITATVINAEGLPEVTLFDKNDPDYKRVLGTDDSALSANGGKNFGNLTAKAGSAIPAESFDAQSHARKLLQLAFNPNLEAVVGPSDPRRILLAGNIMAAPEAAALRNEISRSATSGILPIIRALAPVTETDVSLLEKTQLGFGDSQETWIQKTIEENIPNALNAMTRGLSEAGQSLSVAHQLAFASSQRVLEEVVNNPTIFGDYSTEDAVAAALKMLPNIRNTDINEIPANITLFKSGNGTLYSKEILDLFKVRQNLTDEQLIDQMGLDVVER